MLSTSWLNYARAAEASFHGCHTRRLPKDGAFLIASDDAEEIAGRVGKNHPACAVVVATICNLDSAKSDRPFDLLIAAPISRREVEVNPTLAFLKVLDLDEQELVTCLWIDDHALLIARLVRITSDVDVAEQLLPPLGEFERIGAVDTGMRDPCRHPDTVAVSLAD